MGSTTFGDAGQVKSAGLATPQDIEIDRGHTVRVRASDPV
jgi:hypothetical protein